MTAKNSAYQTGFPHDRHISIRPILEKRGRHPSNIWIFDSPKNDKRLSIQGDVAFMHLVLLEGDLEVEWYDVTPESVYSSFNGETMKTTLDAVVHFRDGREEWWEFKRSIDSKPNREGRSKAQLSVQAQAAAAAGVPYRIKTEVDLRGKDVLFDNWLTLCAAITRAKSCATYNEEASLRRLLNVQPAVSFGSVLTLPGIDPALMTALVAKLLQRGELTTDLDNQLFGRSSSLSWSASHE